MVQRSTTIASILLFHMLLAASIYPNRENKQGACYTTVGVREEHRTILIPLLSICP